jgi:FkbM family methyltransferase
MDENLVYDVGLHIGSDTDFYLRKGFDVVAIEANPALTEHCAERFAREMAAGQLKIVNRAVAAQSGEIEFYVNEENDLWGTANPDWKDRNSRLGLDSRVIRVEASSFQEILSEFGIPYYLKIDIEGNDLLCLQALEGAADKPRHVSIESSATSLTRTLEQLSLLRRLGYSKFKMILQNDVNRQVCPNPAREGKYVDYSFDEGASGLFGEETPGRWLALDETVSAYKTFYRKVSMIGPHTGFFRNIKNAFVKRVLGRIFYPGTGWYDTHATF